MTVSGCPARSVSCSVLFPKDDLSLFGLWGKGIVYALHRKLARLSLAPGGSLLAEEKNLQQHHLDLV